MGKVVKPGDKDKLGTLSDQMRRFAHQYTVDFSGTNAAIRAGYSEKTARVTGSRLLAREDVQEVIRQKMAVLEKNTGITAERVLTEAFGIATADVNDLVEFRRRCCRHCYGIDYGYQRAVHEMNEDRRKYEQDKRKALAKDSSAKEWYEEFDEKGGIGFDARKNPNPNCTSCFGDGVGDAHFKATANLKPEARALYGGVKQTKEGYQMLLIDKNAALEKLFKHLGLYKEDNKQKQADGLTELLAAVMKNGGKLPIKEQD
jgi:phage terminase small subunit